MTEQAPDSRVIIGTKIKAARKAKKMTQKELADIIGKTESSIRKYEKGLTYIPNNVLQQISVALQVPVVDLLCTDEWEQKYNSDGQLGRCDLVLQEVSQIFGSDAVKLLELFTKLNEQGKKNALEHLEDLTNLPKYSE